MEVVDRPNQSYAIALCPMSVLRKSDARCLDSRQSPPVRLASFWEQLATYQMTSPTLSFLCQSQGRPVVFREISFQMEGDSKEPSSFLMERTFRAWYRKDFYDVERDRRHAVFEADLEKTYESLKQGTLPQCPECAQYIVFDGRFETKYQEADTFYRNDRRFTRCTNCRQFRFCLPDFKNYLYICYDVT